MQTDTIAQSFPPLPNVQKGRTTTASPLHRSPPSLHGSPVQQQRVKSRCCLTETDPSRGFSPRFPPKDARPPAMFFMKKLTHTIHLHPSYFGPKIQEVILQKLYADVEGTTNGRYG